MPKNFSSRYMRASGAGAFAAGVAGLLKNRIAKTKTYRRKTTVNKQKATMNVNATSGARKLNRPRRRQKQKLTLKSIKRDIKELKKSAESDEGRLIFRSRISGRNLSTANTVAYSDQGILTTSFLESVLAQLRYYNPEIPGTLTNADGATGTFNKDFNFCKIFCKLIVRNNYQVPTYVAVYTCLTKEDTNISPYTAMTQGLADVGNPTATSALIYPSDSPQFLDLWKVASTKKVCLQPGEELIVTHVAKPFQYDPSLVDSHNLAYQKKYGGMGFLIRNIGVLAHDTVADEQGAMASGIDFFIERTVNVKYSAGADMEYIYAIDTSDAFTTQSVCSSKPVADNIIYAVN